MLVFRNQSGRASDKTRESRPEGLGNRRKMRPFSLAAGNPLTKKTAPAGGS